MQQTTASLCHLVPRVLAAGLGSGSLAPPLAFDRPARGAGEPGRVRRHLAEAERAARARQVVLEPSRALNRRLLLDELRRYRKRGRFPRNHDLRTRTAPVFIDAHGARCAVAHLMEISGLGDLVRHIARTDNHARVRELARFPELREWLAVAGLSLGEAARIQPSYCYESQAAACFCSIGGYSAIAVGTIIEVEGEVIRIRIDRIEGTFPETHVGDERSLEGPGEIGAQALLGRSESTGAAYRVGAQLAIQDDTVRCEFNRATARRPVTIDTAIEAVLAGDRSSCIDVLATDDSAWNQSQCDGFESEDNCGLAQPHGAVDAAHLTSAALCMTLILLRRRRQV